MTIISRKNIQRATKLTTSPLSMWEKNLEISPNMKFWKKDQKWEISYGEISKQSAESDS